MRAARADGGLSLVELVVVMAVFALVATMGLQALTGTLRLSGRLNETAEATAHATGALTLLRNDLKAAAPFVFVPPAGTAQSALTSDTAGQLALTVAGQDALPGEVTAGQGRVLWRFDAGSGQLVRQSWPLRHPLDAGALSPPRVLLDGVRRFEVETWTRLDGWQPGRPEETGTASASLPDAVRITLDTDTLGQLAILVALR